MILYPEVKYMRFDSSRHITGLRSLILDSVKHIQKKNINIPDIKMLELGSYNGESTFLFSSIIKNITVVEPFKNGYDENDESSYANMIKVRKNFEYLNSENKNLIKLKEVVSDEFFYNNKEYFHWIYIDACHKYDNIKKDIQNSINLKPIIISGHDFSNNGVNRAVLENFKDIEVLRYEDDSWMVKIL